MKNLARFLLATSIAAACQLAQAAPTTWAGNGHEYDVITSENVTWTDASAATTLLGGGWHLATVTSASENNFLTSLLSTSENQRSHYWLGGTDVATEGTWTWVTGETWSYTNWWSGEPNNAGGNPGEDYLAFDLRRISLGIFYQWNDAPDNLYVGFPGFPNGYVIERTLQVPEPGLLSLFALALVAVGVTRRKSAGA